MTIVFSPIRVRVRASGPDMSVRLRLYKRSTLLELTLSAAVQHKVRYIEGDRVIARFDEDNKSWSLERVGPDRAREGYKVYVRPLKDKSRSYAFIRLACKDPAHATAVLGAREAVEYEILEDSGNVVTFVEKV